MNGARKSIKNTVALRLFTVILVILTLLCFSFSTAASHVADSEENAKIIDLFRGRENENHPFIAHNMLPGDSLTQFYRLKVTFVGDVTLRFGIALTSDSALSDVLMAKVVLSTTGEVLYDGLIADMPEALEYSMYSSEVVTNQVLYQLTVYMSTDAGNEYMNKTVSADFFWWVDEVDNLETPLWRKVTFTIPIGIIVVGTLAYIIIIRVRRFKEE